MEKKNNTTLNEQKTESPKEDSLLPIVEKGLTFHDSFFEDIRKHFETAIDQILDTWGEARPVRDLMSSYRRVRERNLQQENQVMAFSEDDQNHKVVLDVHDFKRGDVKVRVEDNQVVVEGEVEKEKDEFKSMKSFGRRFNFPGKVAMEGVTSAMSSDGVLTITASKIPQAA
ncbi:protein lethal(2)essential for life-like [Penaeus chinensis]|uniref:protein lethal(2)essential for life-like n=1 Tax=Penaeus chinensis TaxID=139456 RepID=UPI001FB59AC5|nr:protein lethal(2)essential for life-like [Penaeus chinensis]XP_047475054.1 protein lethal(2)essential for life-like [Penaeus chinensis]